MITNITSVIIDDEIAAAENINIILESYCPEVNVLGVANSISDGIKLVKSKNPDIVFLDISMPPEGTGFDFLAVFPNRNFHVIFVTAYDQYSLQAIKEHAFDYILKPIDFKEIIKTIDQYKQIVKAKYNSKKQETIALSTEEGTHIIQVSDILFCKASGSYTEYHIQHRNPILISKTLKNAESKLTDPRFIRVHRSYLINSNMVSKFTKEDGGTIFIQDNVIPVSKKYVNNLNDLF